VCGLWGFNAHFSVSGRVVLMAMRKGIAMKTCKRAIARKRKAVKTPTHLWPVVSFLATTVTGVLAKEASLYLLRALWNFLMRVLEGACTNIQLK
jgi:hypothetical protein